SLTNRGRQPHTATPPLASPPRRHPTAIHRCLRRSQVTHTRSSILPSPDHHQAAETAEEAVGLVVAKPISSVPPELHHLF
ncbi:Os12g0410150, partial [Oryza sativa Japonica Group]